MKQEQGHKRYITSDERCKALATGMYLYSQSLDGSTRDKLHWEAWCKDWGDKMAAQVIQINYDNMTWAINYQD